MEVWRKIWGYLTFKKNKSGDGNINIRMMHGINKISILLFTVGLMVLLIKCLTK